MVKKESTNGGAANPPDTFYSKPVGSTETEVFCVLFPDVCLAFRRSLVWM